MSLLSMYDVHASYHVKGGRYEESIATAYLPVWHAEVWEFIHCRRPDADERSVVREIGTALWIPDVL